MGITNTKTTILQLLQSSRSITTFYNNKNTKKQKLETLKVFSFLQGLTLEITYLISISRLDSI